MQVIGGDVDADAAEVARRVATFDAPALEDALAAVGACGAMVRSAEEWAAHPQRAAIAPLGRVSIEKIADGPVVPVGDGLRPLGGVRVLDLTRVLAGPACARLLAEHGADVLHVNGEHLDNVPAFVIDTGHGKRSTSLDLRREADVDVLRALVGDGDVFSQGYRSGALERRGFGPAQLAELNPGIIAVTINCYGDTGPWRERPGWEQLSQSVTGIAMAEGASLDPAGQAPPRAGRRRRLHHRLPGRAGDDGRAAPAQHRGRRLSRAGVAVPDGDVDRRGRPVRRPVDGHRSRRHHTLAGGGADPVRDAHPPDAGGPAVSDAGAVGDARRAARHPPADLAAAMTRHQTGRRP